MDLNLKFYILELLSEKKVLLLQCNKPQEAIKSIKDEVIPYNEELIQLFKDLGDADNVAFYTTRLASAHIFLLDIYN